LEYIAIDRTSTPKLDGVMATGNAVLHCGPTPKPTLHLRLSSLEFVNQLGHAHSAVTVGRNSIKFGFVWLMLR
jgi:hypothetical protein